MTSHVPSPQPVPASANAPSASDPTTAGAAAAANAEPTSMTTVSSLGALRQKAPKLYNQLMISIGYSCCRSMERSNERVKQMMREGRQNS